MFNSNMKIKCAYKEILDIDDPRIIPNPENPNDHTEEQIIQFVKILKYQGQRKPIIISNQSGFIVTGHGTYMAARKAGAKKIAVDFQDFDSPAQEYAHVVADNALAFQSELDRAKINEKFIDFGPDFDVDMFGFDNFVVDMNEQEQIEKEILFSFKIEVECINEMNQKELTEELESRGFKVRVLI